MPDSFPQPCAAANCAKQSDVAVAADLLPVEACLKESDCAETGSGPAPERCAGHAAVSGTELDPASQPFRILETLNYGVVVADARRPDFPVVYCNAGFETITGYSRQEALHKNCRFLQQPGNGVPAPENGPVRVLVRRALAAGESCDVVLRNFRKDGTPFWNHLHLAPQRNARGELTHFIGTQQDVTIQVKRERALHEIRADLERRVHQRTAELTRANELLYNETVQHRQTVTALQRADERYRGFFENAVVGIYQSTPDGHYLDVNAALARMYGYDTPALLMAAVTDIAHEIYVDPGVRAEFKRRIDADGEVRGMEYQVRRRDGRVIWISEHARAIRSVKGPVLRYEGIVRDITPRKQAEAERSHLEAQLNQAQKMEAIGTLAGGIAHDFNNILGAILGFTELAAADIAPGSLPHQNLQEVLQAAQRAKELVQQILAFSRRSSPERRAIHVRPIVLEVAKLMRSALPSSIEVRTDYSGAPDRIVADPVQIHQVLMNLCTNAGHAMEARGGTLTIGLDATAIAREAPPPWGVLPPGDYLRLSVADTGHGMTQAVLDRIFEPFFTTKPVGEGTGLGLSVVHGIVQAHGGGITVASRPGDGTVFQICFPRSDGAAVSSARETAAPCTGTERILLVDDDAALRNALGQQLRRLHYRVRVCGDSLKALALFRTAPGEWDLLITDLTMPRLSGTSLAREIAAVRPALPVLLITGNLKQVADEGARAAGVSEILGKPLTSAQLAAAVRRVLDRSHPPKAPEPV